MLVSSMLLSLLEALIIVLLLCLRYPLVQQIKFVLLLLLQIQRIENQSFYYGYLGKKREISETCSSTTIIERTLWHGTAADNIKHINAKGFNRSYSSSSTDT